MGLVHPLIVDMVEGRELDDDNHVKQESSQCTSKPLLPSLDYIKPIIYVMRKVIHALRHVTNIDFLLWSLLRSPWSWSMPPSSLRLWLYCILFLCYIIRLYPQNTILTTHNYPHRIKHVQTHLPRVIKHH